MSLFDCLGGHLASVFCLLRTVHSVEILVSDRILPEKVNAHSKHTPDSWSPEMRGASRKGHSLVND